MSPEEAAYMEGDPIENLVKKETEWLGRLEVVKEEIDSAYSGWDQGNISKEEYLNKLSSNMNIVREIAKEYDLHMEVNTFPTDVMNQEVYQDGLAYGEKLRTTVNNYIYMVTRGIREMETGNLKALDDDQIKGLHERQMVETYNDYKTKLDWGLEQAK
ncbi:hypothetical protein N752_00300 [Desulforamulus aquiferis]|nr:hypothetical protein [Desulforamulus aquiferis]RYD07055.1 hypothetical protein N752_00300 [Desulforamulus aquiferis]